MKKQRSFYRLSLITASLLPLLAGCVTDKDFRGLELHVRSMDNRLVELETGLDELKRGAGAKVEVIQKQQAGMGSSINRLGTDFLQVKGQLDESRHRYRSLQSENERLLNKITELQQTNEQKNIELQQRLGSVESSTTEIDSRLSTVHSNLTDLQKAQAREAATRAEAAARIAKQARLKADRAGKGTGLHELTPDKVKKPGADIKENKPAVSVNSVKSDGSSKGMYDEALALFKDKKYKKSHDLFSRFISKHPSSKMAVNARFWLGDCLYNQDEYALAILEYQNVIADHPNHAKAPAALFKQGMAFEKLQDKETSIIVYKKILAEYPKSEQATSARTRMTELGQ